MKKMWCWRCKSEMPMLDEEEWTVIDSHWKNAFAMKGVPIERRFDQLKEAYEQITGFAETNHLAIMHHRISLYGEDCHSCGKPLRTPQAAFCAACGWTPATD